MRAKAINTERWEKINAVQRMQDYIENHLREPVTLQALARASGYSPWHASRIFKDLTGKTPFAYIRELRLSRAAVQLKDGAGRIIDVAFDFVFDSHEGFTRAFSRQFGVSPRSYCRNKPPLNLFMPPRIRSYYLKLQKGGVVMSKSERPKTVFVQVIERPARKVILKRGVKATHYFDYCEEVGCDVWSVLSSIKEAVHEPIGMWLPDNMRKPGTSVYVQGVEVPLDYSGELPEGYEIMELPACKYMVFQGEPFDEDKFEEAIGELWETMKSYNPEIYGFKWAEEDDPRFQMAPMGYRGYIEGRPVRQLN